MNFFKRLTTMHYTRIKIIVTQILQSNNKHINPSKEIFSLPIDEPMKLRSKFGHLLYPMEPQWHCIMAESIDDPSVLKYRKTTNKGCY